MWKWIEILGIIGIACFFPILYTIIVKESKPFKQYKWKEILLMLGAGAIVIIISFLPEYGLIPLQPLLVVPFIEAGYLIIVASIEECMKASVPILLRKKIKEVKEGMLMGVGVGFGFSIIENILYGLRALYEIPQSGAWWEYPILLTTFRAVLLSPFHAFTTGIVGCGIGFVVADYKKRRNVIYFLLLAILLHAIVLLLGDYEELMFMLGIVFGAILLFLVFFLLFGNKLDNFLKWFGNYLK
jgi:RsiW-degrading membrane proteinase PrsW (M82 family)